jgi:hypothetical protein
MTRTILAFAIWISLLAPTAHAQEPKQFIVSQPCDNVLSMTETIMNKYGEQPLFVSEGNQLSARDGNWYSSSMMYFVNQDSGTWSLVSLYEDGTGCMVAAGTNFEPYTD